jgi:hypothetical protein
MESLELINKSLGIPPRIKHYPFAMKNGKYLGHQRHLSFEERLHFVLNDIEKTNRAYKLLFKSHNDQDSLFELFLRNLSLDFDFVKGLFVGDIISTTCFTPKDKLGEAILEVAYLGDMYFVVEAKKYEFRNEIELFLSPCHDEYKTTVSNLIRGVKDEDFE